MKKILHTITVTGADDSTSIDDMLELQSKYPYLEFAILIREENKVSKSVHSCRFPSKEWLNLLSEKSERLNLSLHLCGKPVNDFLENGSTPSHIFFIKHRRMQINTHAVIHKYSSDAFINGIKMRPSVEFIFQLDGVNEHLLTEANNADCKNISGLYDLSHGAGVLPENWTATPNNGIKYGYAGGLSPENVAEQLSKIENLTENTWIDAETYLRTNGKFDLNKVVSFVEAAKLWVK